ncbi:MAG: hypothetical protein ACI4MH_01880 [Candidatus Coproplasma sp.]
MEKNLLKELTAELKISKKVNNSALKRRITGITLAAVFSFATFGLAACFSNGNTDNNGDTNGNTNDNTNTTSKYSQLLTNILNDSEINSLIDRAKADTAFYATAYFDPHPYAFLEKQGEDVARVKSGDLDCQTVSYIDPDEPNNLYMLTYVEVETGIQHPTLDLNYYSEYILKYTLTDKEVADYQMLHGKGGESYVQAVFMNNEISENKTATIISHTYTTVNAHNKLKASFSEQESVTGSDYIGTGKVDCILKDYDVNTQTFNVVVYERVDSYTSMTDVVKIGTLPLKDGQSNLAIENNTFYAPCVKGQYRINNSALDEYQQNIKTVTLYNSQSIQMSRLYNLLSKNT